MPPFSIQKNLPPIFILPHILLYKLLMYFLEGATTNLCAFSLCTASLKKGIYKAYKKFLNSSKTESLESFLTCL